MSRGKILKPEKSSINRLWEGYADRIRRAKREWELAHDRELSWAEVARQCEQLLGKRVFPEQVGRWKDGKQEPTLAELTALGQVLGADPRTLAFGESLQAPVDNSRDHELTVEEHRTLHGETAHDKAAKRRRRTS